MVAMPEHGAKVFLEDKEVGFIGTIARHYELGPIALAVIKRSISPDANLISESVSVKISEQLI
jgi:folate-binding Fe-S cluster repair protein YgfZ